MNKAKEKQKNKSTKEKSLFDFDKEIIIGMKTLPTEETKPKAKIKRKKKTLSKKETRNSNKKNAKGNKITKKKTSKASNKKARKENEDEFELKLGIEDEEVKKRNAKRKKKTTKKTSKQQEIAKKKRKRAFRFIKWTSLILLIIGGIIYFLLSPIFNVKFINVINNEKISSDEIISLSRIQLEENTFKISKSKVEENIKENNYVDSVKIKRKLPDGIEIQIQERKPAYMIMLGSSYIYVSTQGYLLEISQEALALPIIVGYSTPEDEIQPGNRLCTEDLQKLNSVIQILDSANSNDIGNLITKIDIEDKQDYVIEFREENKTAHLGDTSNLSTKMLHIKIILEREKEKEGDIFVNTDLSNKGSIFREKV